MATFITSFPSGFAFAHNPIKVRVEHDEQMIGLHIAKLTLYDPKDGYPNWAPFWESEFPAFPFKTKNGCAAEIDFSEAMRLKEHPIMLFSINFHQIGTGYVNLSHTFSGIVLQGGITSEHFNDLLAAEKDIFLERFLNSEKLFALTTRSANRKFTLRRNELMAVSFVSKELRTIDITLYSDLAPRKVSVALKANSIKSVDIDALVASDNISYIQFEQRGSLNSAFRIFIDYSTSEHSTLLEFRNSVGIMERIELTGKAREKRSFAGDDTRLYSINGMAVLNRSNATNTESIEVSSGYKSNEELLFISDLLLSDEVYLVTERGKRRCKVTGNYSRNIVQEVPQDIPLVITFNQESKFMPYETTEEEFTLPTDTTVLATKSGFLISTRSGQLIGV